MNLRECTRDKDKRPGTDAKQEAILKAILISNVGTLNHSLYTTDNFPGIYIIL